MPEKPDSRVRNLALSVRQPMVELIMNGQKKIEFRSMPTNIRNRVYIYASKKPDKEAFRKMKVEPGDFPVGVLVGTVEIIGCTGVSGDYEWHLANPRRLKKTMKPDNHAQPVWFKPFKE